MPAGPTIISESANPFEHIQCVMLPDVALTLRGIDGSFMSSAKSVAIVVRDAARVSVSFAATLGRNILR